MATWLNSLGISVGEVRVIPDVEKTIIDTVTELQCILIGLNVSSSFPKKNQFYAKINPIKWVIACYIPPPPHQVGCPKKSIFLQNQSYLKGNGL